MRAKIFLLLILAAAFAVRADEKIPVLRAGNEVYSNVVVTSVSATDVYFISAGGMGNVKLKNLSPELQKHFHFDSKQAGIAEQKQVEDKSKYHQQLLHEPAVKAPDMTRDAAPPPHPAAVWREDFPGALQQAQAENKCVLLDFTGSDWCPWCIRFEQDILSTSKFSSYAAQKLELVKVDFPRHAPQPEDLRRANDALAKRFDVDGFPTYVLLNSRGKELGRQVGYLQGGPDAFIAELEKFSR
jgi:thiol:disulfide interchange protein